jgi:glycosyltransferase involved in cell wall biosynthesis
MKRRFIQQGDAGGRGLANNTDDSSPDLVEATGVTDPAESSNVFLFILKQNLLDSKECEGGYAQMKSSGLFNSARMVTEVLNQQCAGKVLCKLELAVDGNCIDRLVTLHKPTKVIIEAVWVTPEKLRELQRLHPKVQWVVRIHSELPFLAQEGIAIPWCIRYLQMPNVWLSFNSERAKHGFEQVYPSSVEKTLYHPNLYQVPEREFAAKKFSDKYGLHIGCFGAVRPFKNIVNQAVAAISYANQVPDGDQLFFHINGSRAENGGEAVLKSLRSLFQPGECGSGHKLVEHLWMDHEGFRTLVSRMDLVTQVSFTETFNIVAADAISVGVPVVTSSEIPWSVAAFDADPTNVKDIASKIKYSLMFPNSNVRLNSHNLSYRFPWTYSSRALAAWKKTL